MFEKRSKAIEKGRLSADAQKLKGNKIIDDITNVYRMDFNEQVLTLLPIHPSQ